MAGPARKRQRRHDAADADAAQLPQKKFYRQRAHANPFSDHDLTYPAAPAQMDWSALYPAFVRRSEPPPHERSEPSAPSEPTAPLPMLHPVRVADIGCGFGGLLFALAPRMPHTLLLGMEIRTSVAEYVWEKTRALRALHAADGAGGTTTGVIVAPAAGTDGGTASATPDSAARVPAPVPGAYTNVSVVRANAMKFLPNFFTRGQLSKIFLCFPDPHFKARKHKARIVSAGLAAEYAFVLAPGGGRLYSVTDVEDLHRWIVRHVGGHAAFARVGEEALRADECVGVMLEETEEGRKVARNGGTKFVAVFERLEDPPWP